MLVYTMYYSSVSWDPMYNRTVLYNYCRTQVRWLLTNNNGST